MREKADYDGCTERPHAPDAGRCNRCGAALSGRRTRWCGSECESRDRQQHIWAFARPAALIRDGHSCTSADPMHGGQLEVNHVAPRRGKGYNTGCWNHADNLETLCHDHHVEVTRAQQLAHRKPTNNTPVRTIRVSDEQWATWTTAAERAGTSVSAVIRALMDVYAEMQDEEVAA